MTNSSPSQLDDELGRETRIGLVMYGGVSLAVYINGVAREFFEAVQGRGVYALLKRLLDSDIVVDIISGASAGGINGVYLAYALANQRDFSRLADLWREHADIDKLLRPISTHKPESLFKAESYYQEMLERAFGEVHARRDGGAPEDDPLAVPSKTEAIDLFVVGTDYHGVRTYRPDALGHVLSAKNYRTLLRLRHRDKRSGSDLNLRSGPSDPEPTADQIESHHRALASVCRITSAFPAALAPVLVPDPTAGRSSKQKKLAWAARVRRWGDIRRPSYFIDGGVLDNKPFSDAIERIFYRTAVRPVDRKIFYVEPDPEEFTQIGSVKKPTFTGVLTSSLLAIPRYESIAGDLGQIEDRNRRLDQYRAISESALSSTAAAPAGHRPDDRTPGSAAYLACRARQFLDPFREYVGETRRESSPSPAELTRTLAYVRAGRDLVDRAAGAVAAGSPASLLDRHDVEFSLRRLFFVSYQLRDALYGVPPPPEELAIGKNLRFALTRHIQVVKLLASVLDEFQRVHTDACIAEAQAEPAALITAIEWRLDTLFDLAPREGEEDLAPLLSGRRLAIDRPLTEWSTYLPDPSIEALKGVLAGGDAGRCSSLPAARPPANRRVTTSILEYLEERTGELIEHFAAAGGPSAVAVQRWRSFRAIDDQLFPLEYVGDLREKDPIKTIRVSPRDAQLGFSRRDATDKVAGDALGHFGGFLKQSWRSNDILWGRLDARCLLIQGLLDGTRLQKVLDGGRRQVIRDRLARDGGLTANVAALFPGSEDRDRQRIVQWLEPLLSDDARSRAAAIEELRGGSDRGDVMVALVRAAQAAILKTDLPDAAAEASGIRLDPDKPEELARYFENKYRVGEEKPLANISGHRLLKTASHTGLIARNALFASLFPRVPLRSSVLGPLKKVLGVPLWSTYWFATLGTLRELRVAMASLSLLLLIVAIGWPVVLHSPDDPGGGVSKLWTTVFVLAPTGYLVFELLVMLMRLGRWAWLILALLAVAAAIWLAGTRRVALRSPVTVSQVGGTRRGDHGVGRQSAQAMWNGSRSAALQRSARSSWPPSATASWPPRRAARRGRASSARSRRSYRLRGRGSPNCSRRADRVLREMPSMRAARV